jgi:membrane-associated phospholipid phosphatase
MARISCTLVVGSILTHGLMAQTVPNPQPFERPIGWTQLIPNILDDQKQIWTFPVRAFKKRNLIPTLAILTVTAGLVAADTSDAPYFRRTNSFHGFNSAFTSNATAIGTAVAPASLYVAGLIGKDSYAKKTALLAGEAVADAEILTTVLKAVDRRVRPSDLPANSSLGDTWFERKGTSGGFPSGHAIAAFSVATIISRRYPHQRWLPYVAYGLAGAVGFSRVTRSAHFPSDVFMGAALGYSISRFSVLRQ